MRIRASLYGATAAAVAVLLLVAGCEQTELTAPPNGLLLVQANPAQLTIDPRASVSAEEQELQQLLGTQERLAFTDLTAQVFDADNLAAPNVAVVFESQKRAIFLPPGGSPTSSTPTVRTDNQGFARVRAIYTESCCTEGEFTVSARSGALDGDARLTLTLGDPNRAPLASITVSPSKPVDPLEGAQAVGRPVDFDGTGSLDPDDDPITLWKWTMTAGVQTDCSTGASTGPPPVEVLQGPTVSGFTRIFDKAQEVAVRLEVTDDPDAPAKFAAGDPVIFSPSADSVAGYKVVCVLCRENRAPTAVIAGADPQRIVGTPGQFATAFFDGRLSSDPETGIDDYVWTCGNGTVAIETGLPAGMARCDYKVESVTRTYTASLVVKDKGTGLPDPRTGTFACQAISGQDTVTVEVIPQI